MQQAAENLSKLKEAYKDKQAQLDKSILAEGGLSRRLGALQQELRNRDQHIAQLEEQLTAHHIRFNRLEEDFQTTRQHGHDQVYDRESKMFALEGQLSLWELAVAEEVERRQSLERQLEEERSQHAEQLAEIEQQRTQLQQRISQLQLQAETLEQERQDAIAELQQEIQTKDRQIAEIQELAQEQVEGLEAELTAQAQRFQEENERQRLERLRRDSQILRLEEDHKLQTQQLSDYQQQLQANEEAKSEIQQRLKLSEDKLVGAASAIGQLKQRLTQAAENLGKLKELYRDKQSELDQTLNLQGSMTRRIQQYQQELKNRDYHIQQLEEQLTHHHIRFNRLEEDIHLTKQQGVEQVYDRESKMFALEGQLSLWELAVSEEVERRQQRGLDALSSGMIAIGAGDCDVQNGLLLALLQRAAVPSRLAVGYVGVAGRAMPWLHAWAEHLGDDGRWRVADASERIVIAPPEAAIDDRAEDVAEPARGVGSETSGGAVTVEEPGRAEAPSRVAADPNEPRPPGIVGDAPPIVRPSWWRRAAGDSRAPWILGVLGLAGIGFAMRQRAGARLRRTTRLDDHADVSRLLRGVLEQPDAFRHVDALLHRRLVPLCDGGLISLHRARALSASGRLYRTRGRSALANRATRSGAAVLDDATAEGRTVADALGAIDLDRWSDLLDRVTTEPVIDAANDALRARGEEACLRVATGADAAAQPPSGVRAAHRRGRGRSAR